jgi:hypothetical protein
MAFEMNYSNVFIVIILLILFYVLLTKVFTSGGLTSLVSAKDLQTIQGKTVSFEGSRNKCYSIWVYVDDWNYRYGSKKIILQRTTENGLGMEVSLGPHSNDLIVDVHHRDVGSSSAGGTGGTIGEGESCSAAGECASGVCGTDGTCAASSHAADHTHDGSGNMMLTSSTTTDTSSFTNMSFNNNIVEGLENKDTFGIHTCTVKNIPLQKFVNIIVSFNNKTLDVYFNGKLVKTCLTKEVHAIDADSDIKITPDSGFSGYTSKFKFWPYPMSPQHAWDVYSEGYSTGLGFANFFAKYNVKFSLLENNVEESSITF